MKRFIRQFILVGLVGVCCFASRSFADIPYLQGFETDTNDWTAYLWMDRVASGSGPLGVSSFQGSYHAVISNKQDAYSAGLGQAGYTYFGNPDATYNGDFFAGISLYVNTNWATGGGFWVDQSPRGTNDATAWDDEQHFKLDVQNPGTVRVTFSGGALPVYLNESGWYTFLETFRRTGPDETDLVQNDFLVFDEAGGLVAARTIQAAWRVPCWAGTVISG